MPQVVLMPPVSGHTMGTILFSLRFQCPPGILANCGRRFTFLLASYAAYAAPCTRILDLELEQGGEYAW